MFPETTLSDALAADELLFDRLVAAYPAYRRFATVLMREDTAGRLTLADVAHMAGLAADDLLAAVASATADAAGAAPASPAALPEGQPDWAEAVAVSFDARPLLESGHEPLPALLDFFEAADATVLAVDASFHPQPLRRLMQGRGWVTAAAPLAPDHWRAYFRRAG